eukprot:4859594-Pleurochrysis_carterae.AAC.1
MAQMSLLLSAGTRKIHFDHKGTVRTIAQLCAFQLDIETKDTNKDVSIFTAIQWQSLQRK